VRDLARVRTIVAMAVVGLLWFVVAGSALAASPSPTSGTGGDPRSSGQGPGLVGDPVFALMAVVLIGLGAMLLTLAYVRLSGRRAN
jgi:hypothetical protein